LWFIMASTYRPSRVRKSEKQSSTISNSKTDSHPKPPSHILPITPLQVFKKKSHLYKKKIQCRHATYYLVKSKKKIN
jgi:hypothetical protein